MTSRSCRGLQNDSVALAFEELDGASGHSGAVTPVEVIGPGSW
jgi:hypothetical protein